MVTLACGFLNEGSEKFCGDPRLPVRQLTISLICIVGWMSV